MLPTLNFWSRKFIIVLFHEIRDDNGPGSGRVAPIPTLPRLAKPILIPVPFSFFFFFLITFKNFNYIKINIFYK